MNTCVIIAASIWLHVNTGYDKEFVNTSNITTIDSRGKITTNSRYNYEFRVWDEKQKRYLVGSEVFRLISHCNQGTK